MDMKTFLKKKSRQQREAIADEAGTTVAYLWQIAGGHSKPGAILCRKIEAATKGKVKVAELRPDIFKKHYPSR